MGPGPAGQAAAGLAARVRVSRASHADWEPVAGRTDPIAILEVQAADRTAELVPIRYGRMLSSPFAFYRGAAAIIAADLAPAPHTGLIAQLCGDAHLSNFGAFLTPERAHVFGLNDFDETLPGPFEWDVKRLATSFEVAGRERGFGRRERTATVLACGSAYRTAMTKFASMGHLDGWYARLETKQIVELMALEAGARHVRRAQRDLARAWAKDNALAFSKLTAIVAGERRFVSNPPLVLPLEEVLSGPELEQASKTIAAFLASYRTSLAPERRHLFDGYHFTHMARKVVGVGSVGTRAWIVLLLGRDDRDPLVLQLKEAQTSVLEPYIGSGSYENHGRRVVEGQRLMQAASDILLGWYRVKAFDGKVRDFYVRQLWDGKYSADIDTMDPVLLTSYARLCGWTLARAHARSGERIAIAAYLGRRAVFDEAVAEFAIRYADQNERDYAALQEAVASGRVSATVGV